MWGGNLIGGYIQTDKAGELNVLLSPKVAWFIRKGLAVGGYANLGLARSYQVAIEWIYQAGVLGKRREGVQIFYRIVNDRVVTLCRAVCTQIAIETDLQA